MTRQDLYEYVADNHPSLTNSQIQRAINMFFETIKNELAKGRRVELRNFGVFDTKNVPGKRKRNPSTGESVQTYDHKAIKFKISVPMRNRLTENEKMRDLNQ